MTYVQVSGDGTTGRVNTAMITHEQRLREILQTTSSRASSQKIKSHARLWSWLLAETQHLGDVTIKERVYWILNGRPDVLCDRGMRKTFSPVKNKYGFCGNIKHCACFRDHASEMDRSAIDYDRVVQKRKITWQEKYGEDNPMKVSGIVEKRNHTARHNRTERQASQHREHRVRDGYHQVVQRLKDTVIPCFSVDQYDGCFRKNRYPWKCVTCGNLFEDHVDYGRVPRCTVCYPKNTTSMGQRELLSFVQSLHPAVYENHRPDFLFGQEIDLFLPDLNIGIEYNGVYWHSSKFKRPQYHVNKMLLCEKNAVRLINIFEDQWIGKTDVVKSRLRNLLGVSPTVYARKTRVTDLDTRTARQFVETHHIQGWCSASVRLGLMLEDQLQAVMTFGKSRYSGEQWELLRYCSKNTVIGGAGKLFSAFVKQYSPRSVVSYADRCWSQGRVYSGLGFKDVTADHENTGYWYVLDGVRYHRSNFTKKKLLKLGDFSDLTESEIMDHLGYLKIHDCGNLKFRWECRRGDTKSPH